MKLQWNQIDWKKAEEQVNRLQIRIVKFLFARRVFLYDDSAKNRITELPV